MLSLGRNIDKFSKHRRLIACLELRRRSRLEECDVMLVDFYANRRTASTQRLSWRRDVVRETASDAPQQSVHHRQSVGHKAADDVARKSIRPQDSTLISTEWSGVDHR